MKRTFKYRLNPNKTQIETLNQTFELCRNLYNDCLEQRILAYKQLHKPINKYDQLYGLPAWKSDHPEYSNVYAQVLQDVVKRVDLAYRNFFRKCKNKTEKAKGFPRFKSFDHYHSITYPQINKLKFNGNKLLIPKIGLVKIAYHRNIPDNAQIKLFSITRHVDKFYICICFNLPDPVQKVIDIDKVVGIDMGIKTFAVLSNGEQINYPKFLQQSELKLKQAQQILSRKKRGSNRRKKAKLQVAKVHEKISNRRQDFLHKESRRLADKFDAVCFEDLKIQRMLNKNYKNLNKSINDNAWNNFIGMTSYKVETLGGCAIKVDPKNTSQTCSKCGQIVKKDLSVRMHNCPNCKLSISRDFNAAHNIKRLGTSQFFSEREANEFIHW